MLHPDHGIHTLYWRYNLHVITYVLSLILLDFRRFLLIYAEIARFPGPGHANAILASGDSAGKGKLAGFGSGFHLVP